MTQLLQRNSRLLNRIHVGLDGKNKDLPAQQLPDELALL
jgi:hypothetical protein